MPFVILTAFLMPLCILASWTSIATRVKEFMIAFLVLETLMIGVFAALDLVLFYLFFEGGLIPMFLIIGIWGGQRRVYASFKFFLYTLAGSVLMLVAIMAMYWEAGTTDIPALLAYGFPPRHAVLAVVRLPRLLRREAADVAGPHLAARRPCRSADRGLGHPRRHSLEDGRLRLLALLAPDVPARLGRIRADDVRALGHRHHLHLARRVGAGRHEEAHRLFLRRPYGLRHHRPLHPHQQGLQGGIFQMITHGIVSAALFLCVGVDLRPHAHARDHGLWRPRQPHAALRRLFMVFTMANVGLPGTSGFVGEFLSLAGAFREHLGRVLRHHRRHPVRRLCALALPPRHLRRAGEAEPQDIEDLTWREIVVMAPLVALTILFGFYPAPIFDAMRGLGRWLIKNYHTRACRGRAGAARARAIGDASCRSPSTSPPRLPELILAVGAMALLMLGVFARREQWRARALARVLVLVVAGVLRRARHAARDRCSAAASSSIRSPAS